MIHLSTLLVFYVGLSATTAADLSAASASNDAWRSDCKRLLDPRISPFLYLMQSDLAVLAEYSNVDYQRFENGQKLNFYITPVCFVKGYVQRDFLNVISGSQRCKNTPLNNLLEFPSLFFLRRLNYSDNWLLLNSGEYRHIADNKGILFGLGPSGNDFPQTCGVSRRPSYTDLSCETMKCKSYCAYKVAPPNNCLAAKKTLKRFMPENAIPKYVEPLDSTKRTSTERSSGGGGNSRSDKSQKITYEEGNRSLNQSAPQRSQSVNVVSKGGDGNSAHSPLRALHSLVLTLSGAVLLIVS